MANVVSQVSETAPGRPFDGSATRRVDALADRLMHGAEALAAFASSLTDAEWQTRLPKDGRKIGVVIHHVASVYPVEIAVASVIAGGKPVTGVTAKNIDDMN